MMLTSAVAPSVASAAEQLRDITPCLPAENNKTIITGADVKFTDQSGNPVANDQVNTNTNLKLEYTWAVPNQLVDNCGTLKTGDYFSYQLPAGAQYKAQAGELKNSAGTVFGNYAVTDSGQVTLVFTSAAEGKDNVKGTFNYYSTISSSTTTGENKIIIPTTEGPKEFPIIVNPTGGNDIAKAGALIGATSTGKNPTGITWDVTINTNLKQLTNATVTDPMPSSADGKATTTFKDVAVYPLTVDNTGKVTAAGDPLVKGVDYTVGNDGTVSFIGKYAETRTAFKISYASTINSTDDLVNNGGQVTFTNKATLNNDGKQSPATASVTANYGTLLDKHYDGADGNGGQNFKWHIDYNNADSNLPAGTKISDTLSDGQEFVKNQFKLAYQDGKPVEEGLYSVQYTDNPAEMTITFPNGLTKAVRISYQSHVIDPIVDGSKTVISNKASSNGKDSYAKSGTITSQGLTKTVNGVDYNTKDVTWKFDINMARQLMKNWSLTDTVPDGLSVDYKSFVLTKHDDPKFTYKEGTDFEVVPSDNGFKVNFLNDLKVNASDWYVLTYKTSFDTSKLPKNGKWTNTATATWTDYNGKKQTNKGSADFTPKQEFRDDGSKSGSYNATTKHITWTVVGNYNQRELKSASIIDPILGDQDYIDGSAKVYPATINTNGSYTKAADADASLKPTYDAASKTVSVKLPNGSKSAYVLQFDTSLDGKLIKDGSYSNKAIYENDGKSQDLNASISVPNAGNMIEKNGAQDNSNMSYVNWSLLVNKTQSTLDKVKVTDKPTPNQSIDVDSIKVYPTTVDQWGNVRVSDDDRAHPLVLGTDYSVNLTTDDNNQATLTISFLKTISTSYSVEYRSLITSDKDTDKLSNSVTITGENAKVEQTQDTQKVVDVTSGGSADGRNTTIVLTKKDGDTNKALGGAAFELWTTKDSGDKSQLLRAGTTDDNGQLTWKTLRAGKYLLFEKQAPQGYDISADLARGVIVNVAYSQSTDGIIYLNYVNEQKTGSVVLSKTDGDTGKALAGATFALFTKDGTQVKSGLVTDDKGKITVDGLKPGDYYFQESAAPAGYVLNDKRLPFTVVFQSEAKVAAVAATNEQKTGSVIPAPGKQSSTGTTPLSQTGSAVAVIAGAVVLLSLAGVSLVMVRRRH